MKLHRPMSRSCVLLSSALMLALYATPVTYDFEHGQWQAKGAYAADSGNDDEGSSPADGGVLPPVDDEVMPPVDDGAMPPNDDGIIPPVDNGTMPPSDDDE